MGDASPNLLRFTVVGRAEDRELIRTLAKRLAENGPDVDRLRIEICKSLTPPLGTRRGILAALRRAPVALADVKFERVFARERKLDL